MTVFEVFGAAIAVGVILFVCYLCIEYDKYEEVECYLDQFDDDDVLYLYDWSVKNYDHDDVSNEVFYTYYSEVRVRGLEVSELNA